MLPLLVSPGFLDQQGTQAERARASSCPWGSPSASVSQDAALRTLCPGGRSQMHVDFSHSPAFQMSTAQMSFKLDSGCQSHRLRL